MNPFFSDRKPLTTLNSLQTSRSTAAEKSWFSHSLGQELPYRRRFGARRRGMT
jgi:hypothetical protein